MWLMGLGVLCMAAWMVTRYVIRRNQCLEIRRRELLVIRADLEALAEEGEIFREEEPYQILREHIEALLPVVKGWSLRRLLRTIEVTRFGQEVRWIRTSGTAKKSVVFNAPETKHLVTRILVCTMNIIADRSWYTRMMIFFNAADDALLRIYIIEQIVHEAEAQ